MIILGTNTIDQIVYYYNDQENNMLSKNTAYNLIKSNKFKEGEVVNKHLLIYKEDGNNRFYFFFDDIKNKKEGRHRAKILYKGIQQLFIVSKETEEIVEYIHNTVIHNTKNIIHSLANRIKKIIDYENIVYVEDKIGFINNRLNSENIFNMAKELLAYNKSLEQISFEYNIGDYLRPNFILNESDKTFVKIHSLIVQTFYIYEQNFKDKKIKVNIDKTHSEIKCNFFTMRSAFALLFENCWKYCLDDTEIDIDVISNNGNIKIDIGMKSISNTEDEMRDIFLPRVRGKLAEQKEKMGNGMGLYITKRLFNLNDIELLFKKINNDIKTVNNLQYGNNIFIIDIPNRIIK